MGQYFVLDASALVEVMGAVAPDPALSRRVRTGRAAAPELVDLEVLSTLRKQVRSGAMNPETADRIVTTLRVFPVERSPHRTLVPRVWELRHSVTSYDAVYVALAEQLGIPLVTTDARLAEFGGHRAEIELYPAS